MYATGNCSTRAALVDAVCAFAVANAGFTLTVSRQANYADGATQNQSVPYDVRCLTKGTDNFFFASTTSTLWNGIRGFHSLTNDGSGYRDTSGVCCDGDFSVAPAAAPFLAYHLFTEGTCVHCAAQMPSGGWIHFTFGNITKYNTSWVGGAFMLGMQSQPQNVNDPNYSSEFYLTGTPNGGYYYNNPITQMYIPFGSAKYGVVHPDPSVNFSHTPINFMALGGPSGCMNWGPLRDNPSQFNGRTMGIRLECFMGDSTAMGGATNLWRPLGYIPNLRAIRTSNLNDGDIINDDWMCFPCQSNFAVPNQHANTFGYGWAIQQ